MELAKKYGNVTATNGNGTFNGIDFQWLIPLDGIQSKLKWMFSVHVYFFGCMYFVLAFYTFSSILNIRSQISRKRFMSGINTFVCIFGISRAASLFVDPYGSHKLLPAPITNAIWAIGFPSLVSSFCLLQLAFLHLTKLKYGFKLLRVEILLRSIITLHIFTSVLRAVISSMHWSVNIVIINYVCEFVFLSWSFFLHISFLHIGRQVFKLLNRVPATMLQPDGCQSKGIMQLVMLAPASNLVTSVTAALMPTLLGPAANMATKPGFGAAQSSTTSNIKPKIESNIVASTSADNPGKTKEAPAEPEKPKQDGTLRGGPKIKKLTWQSSISNDNVTENTMPKVATNVAKRPILKESSKLGRPKIGTSAESKNLENSVENSEKAGVENDLLLHTILNHIAYVNRASGSDTGFSHCGAHDATPTSRKRQVRFVLKITYATAILGFCLTVAEFFQKFGPYGLMKYFMSDVQIRPWPWFVFQSICRSFELLMGSAIANITKQPAAGVQRYYKYNPTMMNQPGMFM